MTRDITVEHAHAYCTHCRAHRPVWHFVLQPELHIIITICTFGLWLAYWIPRAIYNRWGIGWRCSVCNGRISRKRVSYLLEPE